MKIIGVEVDYSSVCRVNYEEVVKVHLHIQVTESHSMGRIAWMDRDTAKFLDNQFNATYRFRGLPANITAEDEIWCVSGSFGAGGGVLEWCYDEADALDVLAEMQKDSRFSGLKAEKYKRE